MKSYNIFKETLNEVAPSKIKIMPEVQKGAKIADQFENMLNWQIVRSTSDSHPDCGYPMGQILCRSQKEAEDYIEKSQFRDCYIESYTKKEDAD